MEKSINVLLGDGKYCEFVYKWMYPKQQKTNSAGTVRMSDNYILNPYEVESYVENLKPFDFKEIGTQKWFEYHKQLILLNQQSILEISTLREEFVKESFVSFQKISVLIHEVIQTDVWKEKIFPLLTKLNGEPSNTFMLYSVFYHESVAMSLLENVLYHVDSVETLDDTILDLVDYAVKNVTALIFDEKNNVEENLRARDISCLEELSTKRKDIEFDNGMKCISVLRYLAEFSDKLPLCVLSRMLSIHDVPYLLTQLIEKRPWKLKNEKGETMIYNGKWETAKPEEHEKLCKVEGQVWLGLRELMLNQTSAPYYELTEFRISRLTMLQKHLQESVLDQITPLIELRRWLSYLSISQNTSNAKPPLSVEVLPQLRSAIMEKYRNKWKKTAKYQSTLLYTKNPETIKNVAQVLSHAYDIDKVELNEMKKCARCKENASQRCSKCKDVWYCGRECQVKDWSTHKAVCAEILKSKSAFGIQD